MKIDFYHHEAACSLGVLIGLEESGLAFDLHRVDILGERGDYLNVNPAGKVPALVIDGCLLTESLAILYHVAQLVPDRMLFPVGPLNQAQALSTMAWFSSTVHIARRQIRMPKRFTEDEQAQAALIASGRPKMWQILCDMEARLGAGPWFAGEQFTVVDAYGLVFYNWALRDDFPMSDLEGLTAWKDRMLRRPAVRRALAQATGPLHDEAMQVAP